MSVNKLKTPKKPRVPKPAPEITLAIPPKAEGIDQWLILGLDPSLSRTGYAVMLVKQGEDRSTAQWLSVGSISPEDASDPQWVRSKAIATFAKDVLQKVITELFEVDRFSTSGVPLYDDATLERISRTGLIISFEAPTPGNDFLITISRILHLVMFEAAGQVGVPFPDYFGRVHVQLTNAATLRRLMGLTQRGNKNKKENVARAYNFLDQGFYPNLDTDACDAVLMGMMARYSAAVLLGHPDSIPEQFRIALCDATQEVKGKGRNQRTRTKGIFYRPEYWSEYRRKSYVVQIRDARVKQARLPRREITI
jgi:hypothetical protein